MIPRQTSRFSFAPRSTFWATLPRFLLVGVVSTTLSAAIMFVLYNLAATGYWASTAVSYVIGATFSFFANRSFTFRDKGSMPSAAWRFFLVIVACYAVSFTIARPACRIALHHLNLPPHLVDNVAMLMGMVVFTALNYVGQRAFTFGNTV